MTVDMLSAGGAARRLGVSPATIQRWVDIGHIYAVRTPGGHRRIPISEIRRLLAEGQPAQLGEPLASWVETLMRADAALIQAAMLETRRRSEAWSMVAEEIASAIAEIGRLWEAGLCRIFEEHAASEALHRACAGCAASIRVAPAARSAALSTVEGERHTLGLSLAELVVVEAGWKPLWLGEGVPIEDLDLLLELKRIDILIVCASPASSKQGVSRYQSALERVASERGVGLFLAGDGPWIPSKIAQRIESFEELRAAL